MWLHSDCDPKHLMSVFANIFKMIENWSNVRISNNQFNFNWSIKYTYHIRHPTTTWFDSLTNFIHTKITVMTSHVPYTYAIQYWLNADLQKFLLAQKCVTLAHSCTHSRLPFNLVIRRCFSACACAGTVVVCAPLWFALLCSASSECIY